VRGIGQQGQGVDLPAVKRLYAHEAQIERNANGKGPIKAGGCVRVVVVFFRHWKLVE
jgi:hypothetical protein